MYAQALAGPQGSAEASLQSAQPCPAAAHAHEALPDSGQSPLKTEAPPQDAPELAALLQDASLGAASGDTVEADTGLPQALPNPRALLEPCLLPSQAAGVRQVQIVPDEEAMDLLPGRPDLTRVETALLPVLIRVSSGVIDTLLRRLREALGPALLRWGCLKDFDGKFTGYGGTVSPPPLTCMPSPLVTLPLPCGAQRAQADTWSPCRSGSA